MELNPADSLHGKFVYCWLLAGIIATIKKTDVKKTLWRPLAMVALHNNGQGYPFESVTILSDLLGIIHPLHKSSENVT